MNKGYILLYGYGWSGSGAVLDYLKENSEIEVSDKYFFLLRDRGGLIDLHSNLITNWDMFRSSVAINDFLNLCNRSKKPMLSFFSKPGRNYKTQFGLEFDNAIAEFLSEICDFRYYGYEHSLNMSKNYIDCQVSRLIHQMDKHGIRFPLRKKELYYFAKPSEQTYFSACRDLINKLNLNKCQNRYLLIDHHPLPVHSANLMDRYFGENSKMIVVDRDPRDIFIDLINNRMRIGADLYRTMDVEKYIVWHKKSREYIDNNNILKVRFEDFVLKYEETSTEILKYLGLDDKTHVSPLKYFDPSVSEKNIGMYKKSTNSSVIKACKLIEKELSDYCINI